MGKLRCSRGRVSSSVINNPTSSHSVLLISLKSCTPTLFPWPHSFIRVPAPKRLGPVRLQCLIDEDGVGTLRVQASTSPGFSPFAHPASFTQLTLGAWEPELHCLESMPASLLSGYMSWESDLLIFFLCLYYSLVKRGGGGRCPRLVGGFKEVIHLESLANGLAGSKLNK